MSEAVEEPHWEKHDTELMDVGSIEIVDRIVHPTKARIDAMAKSLSGPLGQIEPILVTRHLFSRFKVVAGATRLLAAKQLGWKQIEATLIMADNSFEYQLIEIEENLGRHDLGDDERRLLSRARKEILAKRLAHLEEIVNHPAYTGRKPNTPPPEKAKGGRGKKGGVADAARKAGVSRSTAQRHIAKKAKPAQTEKRAGLGTTKPAASASEIMLRSEQVMIEAIKFAADRKPDERIVEQLMTSINKIGLLEPIVVCRPANQMGVYLVAGRNRLEACRRLKHKDIAARVISGDTPEIRQWRKQAEIDENLTRAATNNAERNAPKASGDVPNDICFSIGHRISTVQALAVDAAELLKRFSKHPFATAKKTKANIQDFSGFADAAIQYWSNFKRMCDDAVAADHADLANVVSKHDIKKLNVTKGGS